MSFASLGDSSFEEPKGGRALRWVTLAVAALLWGLALLFATMASWTPAAFAAVVALLPTILMLQARRRGEGRE